MDILMLLSHKNNKQYPKTMKRENNDDEPTAPLVVVTPTAPSGFFFDQAPPHSFEWTCPQCTLINHEHVQFCDACNYCKKSLIGPPPQSSTERDQPVSTHILVESYSDKIQYHTREPSWNREEYFSAQAIPGEDPLAKKRRRRRRRRWRMAAGATAGMIVGTSIFFGPWGTIVGGVTGAAVARVISKRGERKKDLRVANSRLSEAIVN